jgi:hypothetical protein
MMVIPHWKCGRITGEHASMFKCNSNGGMGRCPSRLTNSRLGKPRLRCSRIGDLTTASWHMIRVAFIQLFKGDTPEGDICTVCYCDWEETELVMEQVLRLFRSVELVLKWLSQAPTAVATLIPSVSSHTGIVTNPYFGDPCCNCRIAKGPHEFSGAETGQMLFLGWQNYGERRQ